MAILKRWDRSCNPLNLKAHKNPMLRVHLRRASRGIADKYGLSTNDWLCTNCRKKLVQTEPTSTAKDIDNVNTKHSSDEDVNESMECASACQNINDEVFVEESQNTDPGTSSAASSSTSQLTLSQLSKLSELSIETRLPVVNEAFKLLNESPIPKKKIKTHAWMEKKVVKVSGNLKRSLGVAGDSDLNAQDSQDYARCFQGLIEKSRIKYQEKNITRSEKIQILTLLPAHWSTAKIVKLMGSTEYMVKKAKELYKTRGVLGTPNSKLGRKIPDDLVTKVIHFYNDDRVSMNMPGMKDYVSMRNDNNEKIHVQKRLILSNLKELFELFRLEYPEAKIGFSMFATLRPKNCVLAGASGTHTVCVCAFHQNMKLMIIGCNLPELTRTSSQPINDYNDCLNLVICPSRTSECYLRNCPSCPGLEALHNILEEALAVNDIESVKYKNWITAPRTTLETVVKDSSDFIGTFCDRIETLLAHHFIAKEQANFLRFLKESLKINEFLIISDFAENYAFVIQDAAPGFHWNNNQATIYPVVVYYKVNDVIEHKSLVIVSDSMNHDSIAVHVFTKIVIDFIKSMNKNISKVYYFSDGAPQQYKNYKHFIDLYYHKEDHGIDAEWHFFATAHGKGPYDGVGGTFKRKAANASLQRAVDRQITTPPELFEWGAQAGSLPNIVVKFSSVEQYQTVKIFLENRYSEGKRVPGTHQLHCVIPQTDGIIHVKDFSKSDKYSAHRILKRV